MVCLYIVCMREGGCVWRGVIFEAEFLWYLCKKYICVCVLCFCKRETLANQRFVANLFASDVIDINSLFSNKVSTDVSLFSTPHNQNIPDKEK